MAVKQVVGKPDRTAVHFGNEPVIVLRVVAQKPLEISAVNVVGTLRFIEVQIGAPEATPMIFVRAGKGADQGHTRGAP